MADDDDYDCVKKGTLKLKGRQIRRKSAEDTSILAPVPPVPRESQQISIKLTKDERNDVATVEEKAELADIDANIKRIMNYEHLTQAEKSFQIARYIRRKERIEERLALTHRERMTRFNTHLANLSEHFDIPKVGPG